MFNIQQAQFLYVIFFFLVCFGLIVILHKSSSTTIHRQHFSVDPFRLFAREETHGVSDIQRVATSVEWRGIGSGLREEKKKKKKLASCKVLETRKKGKKKKGKLTSFNCSIVIFSPPGM